MSKPGADRNIEVPDSLVKELLTDAEMRMVKQRFLIIQLLFEGLSIRKIAAKAKVGTDTVVRVARMIERKKLFEQLFGKSKKDLQNKKTAWVFGKSE